uniref:Uncharacterized protein n=1 Tax=Candidatus Kentrum sp. DK TaxID=2126562 RepID=A0A450SGH2_9GAMM|nr:MAG: hypothetical protein BECKDK2373C_GA0170839_103511 [Candidatus Kentron sp. DK]
MQFSAALFGVWREALTNKKNLPNTQRSNISSSASLGKKSGMDLLPAFRAVCKTHLALPNGVKNGLKMLSHKV